MSIYSKIAQDIYNDAEKLDAKNPDDIGKIKGIIKRYNSFCTDAILIGKTENTNLQTNSSGGLTEDSEAAFERVKGELKAYTISHPPKEQEPPSISENIGAEQTTPPPPKNPITYLRKIPGYIYVGALFLAAICGIAGKNLSSCSDTKNGDTYHSTEKELGYADTSHINKTIDNVDSLPQTKKEQKDQESNKREYTKESETDKTDTTGFTNQKSENPSESNEQLKTDVSRLLKFARDINPDKDKSVADLEILIKKFNALAEKIKVASIESYNSSDSYILGRIGTSGRWKRSEIMLSLEIFTDTVNSKKAYNQQIKDIADKLLKFAKKINPDENYSVADLKALINTYNKIATEIKKDLIEKYNDSDKYILGRIDTSGKRKLDEIIYNLNEYLDSATFSKKN